MPNQNHPRTPEQPPVIRPQPGFFREFLRETSFEMKIAGAFSLLIFLADVGVCAADYYTKGSLTYRCVKGYENGAVTALGIILLGAICQGLLQHYQHRHQPEAPEENPAPGLR